MVYFLWLSRRICALVIPFFSQWKILLAVDASGTSSTFTCSSLLTSPDPGEYDELNIWNPTSELLCHTHIGMSMAALFDEEGMGRIALSCHFALDILCDKEGASFRKEETPLVDASDKPSKTGNDETCERRLDHTRQLRPTIIGICPTIRDWTILD